MDGSVLASFVAFHEVTESACPQTGPPAFAVVLARDAQGVVLVFNRYRKVWELPGGRIDPGESPREAVARELEEEAGCSARQLSWLGVVEVNDGATHFGAVFACSVGEVPVDFQSEEIGGIDRWAGDRHPRPLGACDAALLERFG